MVKIKIVKKDYNWATGEQSESVEEKDESFSIALHGVHEKVMKFGDWNMLISDHFNPGNSEPIYFWHEKEGDKFIVNLFRGREYESQVSVENFLGSPITPAEAVSIKEKISAVSIMVEGLGSDSLYYFWDFVDQSTSNWKKAPKHWWGFVLFKEFDDVVTRGGVNE